MATHPQRVDRRFAADRFSALALRGLDALELKARAMQLCEESTQCFGIIRAARSLPSQPRSMP
jgi:hypothetical protein